MLECQKRPVMPVRMPALPANAYCWPPKFSFCPSYGTSMILAARLCLPARLHAQTAAATTSKFAIVGDLFQVQLVTVWCASGGSASFILGSLAGRLFVVSSDGLVQETMCHIALPQPLEQYLFLLVVFEWPRHDFPIVSHTPVLTLLISKRFTPTV